MRAILNLAKGLKLDLTKQGAEGLTALQSKVANQHPNPAHIFKRDALMIWAACNGNSTNGAAPIFFDLGLHHQEARMLLS